MAQLQKTLQSPGGISSRGTPSVGPDTSTASAINAVSGLVTEGLKVVDKQRFQSDAKDLEQGLQDVGQDVSDVRAGKTREGEVSERFMRLKRLKEAGTLSDAAINIETEKELKRAIGHNPGKAKELKELVFNTIGFDPTGSFTKSLLGKSTEFTKARPLTAREKRQEEAEFLAQNVPGLSAKDALGLMAQANVDQMRSRSVVAQAQIGQAGMTEITASHLQSVDSSIMDAMGRVLTTVEEGGIKDPEALSSAITLQKQRMFQAISNSARDSDLTMDRVAVKAQVDAAFAGVEDMIASGTMQKIMERNVKELTAASSIIGFETFGHIIAMEKAGGQVMVKAYLDGLVNINSPEHIKLMMAIDPTLASALGNKKLLADKWSASWANIMGTELPAGNRELPTPGMNSIVTQSIIGTEKDPDIRNRTLQNVKKLGLSYRDFGMYGQPGVIAIATDLERKHVTDNWAIDLPKLKARVGKAISDTPGLTLKMKGDKILIVGAQPFAGAEGTTPGRFTPAPLERPGLVPRDMQKDIDRLNAMNKMVQNGWGDDVGEDPANFLVKTTNEMIALGADVELEDDKGLKDAMALFNETPSLANFAAVKAADPAVAAAVLKRSAELSGGKTNAK